jgi:AraC-like DNA-binding protein
MIVKTPPQYFSIFALKIGKNMAFGNAILFFFSALGAFNGLLLSVYLFFFAPKRGMAHSFLGILLLVSSIRMGKSVLYNFDHSLPKIYLQIGLSACYFIGPALYFFLKSSLNPIKQLPTSWKIHLSILSAVLLIGGMVYPYSTHPSVWNHIYVPIIYAVWAVYLVLGGVLIKDIFKKIVLKPAEIKAFDIWLSSIYSIIFLIFAAYQWAYFGGPYISGAITFSFVMYVGIFILVNRKKNDDLFSNPLRSNPKNIGNAEAQLWQTQLEQLMTVQQIFKSPNLKLQDVADAMNLSSHQLSQFLNDKLGKNFTQFVNEYRIQEACKLLETNTLLSIEGIGDEVGFNSKSTFFTAFKKLKGATPAAYQQSMAKT